MMGKEEGGDEKAMMDNLMGEFTQFMDSNKDNPDMKATFDQMMSQMLSKEAVLPPLLKMKEGFPKYLEDNQEKLLESPEELDRYNSQLEAIEEIVKMYEDAEAAKVEVSPEQATDALNRLQELGAPPKELLDQIGLGFPGGGEGMPDMEEMMKGLM